MPKSMSPESLDRLRALARAELPAAPSPASDDLVRLLGLYDLECAEDAPGLSAVRVVAQDDGAFAFTLPLSEVPTMQVLATLLQYAKLCHRRGMRQGELNARAQMRTALGFED